jgi:hypothetical protein
MKYGPPELRRARSLPTLVPEEAEVFLGCVVTDAAIALLSLLHIIRRRRALLTKESFDQSPPVESDHRTSRVDREERVCRRALGRRGIRRELYEKLAALVGPFACGRTRVMPRSP